MMLIHGLSASWTSAANAMEYNTMKVRDPFASTPQR